MTGWRKILLIIICSSWMIFLGIWASSQDDFELDPIDPHHLEFEALGVGRSPHWPTVRLHYVRAHRSCAACGTNKLLQVHHIVPFHVNKSLELDPNNLITLCRDHHFIIGHLRNYKNSNPNVRADAAKMLQSIQEKDGKK